jgi:transposase-like protein
LLSAAIDTESKLLREVDMYSRYCTDLAAALLYRPTNKQDVPDVAFLVDGVGYQTALVRWLNSYLNHSE